MDENKALDRDLLGALGDERGERVLAWLEKVCNVRESITPEEALNQACEVANLTERVPIDPLGLAKRGGMRAVYWKIVTRLERARKEAE